MARGIKDKVAILGMGCSKFGERWDAGAEELMLEAYKECLADAGIDAKQLNAAWFSTAIDEVHVGKSGIPLSTTLRLPNIPVTHVENMCASGTEAFRGACYAVASGAADFALALGVEKLKDTGYGGLPGGRGGPLQALWSANGTAPGNFAQLATAYMTAHGVVGRGPQEGDRPRLVEEPSERRQEPQGASAEGRRDGHHPERADDRLAARPVRLLRRVGRRGRGHRHHARDRQGARQARTSSSVKALQLSVSNGSESGHNSWDGSYFHTTRIASKKAYEEAGIKNPRDEVSMFEVHDCFSVTELVTMEDLHISETGKGWKDVLDGFYDADGKIPCQIDGGLKCFGHPIGASGLRMLYEMYLQFQGRAGARQLKDPRIGMTHNLGGAPRENVSSVAIVGRFE